MYRKNTAGQAIGFQLNNAAGAGVTGATVAVNFSLDGAGAYSSGAGTVNELGGGGYEYVFAAADLNGNTATFQFSAAGAIAVEKSVIMTAADTTDGQRFGLTALPAADAAASGGLIINGANTGAISFSSNFIIDGNFVILGYMEIDDKLYVDNGIEITGDLAVSGAYTGDFGAVWDVTLASHVTAGSTGEALNAAGGAGDPWITALPGAYAAGSAGNIIGNYLAELYMLDGLKSGTDLVVTATSRTAGTISQTIATVAGTTTVSR